MRLGMLHTGRSVPQALERLCTFDTLTGLL